MAGPRKRRVEVVATPAFTGQLLVGRHRANTPELVTVAEKPGLVTSLDRARAYAHTVIAVLSTLLIFLNGVLDVVPTSYKGVADVAIVLVGALVTAVKSNEIWINDS